jgi:hypothetical protein
MDFEEAFSWFDGGRSKVIFTTAMIAKVQRNYYEALVAEGFTPEQAQHAIDVAVKTLITTAPEIMMVLHDTLLARRAAEG